MTEEYTMPCGCRGWRNAETKRLLYGSCRCERCPYCKQLISIRSLSESLCDIGGDQFYHECPHCEKEIDVHVEYKLTFTLTETEE